MTVHKELRLHNYLGKNVLHLLACQNRLTLKTSCNDSQKLWVLFRCSVDWWSLTTDAVHVLVRALIHSHLDYCNGLLAGLPDNQLTRLQSVLCAAARLSIQVPSRAPVSVAMCDVLHWLSFPQRMTFKLCLLTYKCLHSLAPEYLLRCCVPLAAVPGRSQLRSADERHLLVPRTSTVMLGPRAFYLSGPASWNSVPTALRHPDFTLSVFKRQLKTFFFTLMYDSGLLHHARLCDDVSV